MKFTIGGTGLEFDRDYGIDKRTGWHVVHKGGFEVQFVSFWRALCVLLTILFWRYEVDDEPT